MKKWRVVYWSGLNKAEWIVRASDESEAVRKFKELKGDVEIVDVFETSDNEHN